MDLRSFSSGCTAFCLFVAAILAVVGALTLLDATIVQARIGAVPPIRIHLFPVDSAAPKWTDIAQATAALLGVMIAVTAGLIALRTMRTTQLTHLFTRVDEHNRLISENPAFQAVLAAWSNLEMPTWPPGKTAKFNEIPSNMRLEYDIDKKRMATRMLHLNHVNLVYQAWQFAVPIEVSDYYYSIFFTNSTAKKCLMEKYFSGWVKLAKATKTELEANDNSKPQWYKLGCNDIKKFMEDSNIYDKEFVGWYKTL
jgi:hypothetical protein